MVRENVGNLPLAIQTYIIANRIKIMQLEIIVILSKTLFIFSISYLFSNWQFERVVNEFNGVLFSCTERARF